MFSREGNVHPEIHQGHSQPSQVYSHVSLLFKTDLTDKLLLSGLVNTENRSTYTTLMYAIHATVSSIQLINANI